MINNGLIKPKSRNDKNNLTILKLKKESNTFDYSILRQVLANNPKIKSRNNNANNIQNNIVKKDIKNTLTSSFTMNNIYKNNNFMYQNTFTSSSNSSTF